MMYIDGKFIDDNGNVVPPKFGDRNQIWLLQRVNENAAELRAGTYEARIWDDEDEDDGEEFYAIDIHCICGRCMSKMVYFNGAGGLGNKKHTCECGREYSLRDNPESEFSILVKLSKDV